MKKLLYLFLTVLIVACSSDSNDGDNNGDNNENQSTDTTAPVITIVGEAVIDVLRGSTYIDEGATAIDDVDGDITSLINSNAFDVNTLVSGEYIITYEVYDTAGNYSSATRTVNVIDNGNPIVGDLTNGGVVFWVNPQDNTKGLVAAIDFLENKTWSNLDCEGPFCGPYNIYGGPYIGDGEDNTNAIVDLLSYGGGVNYAAFYAKEYNGSGYNDWFLPSSGEIEAFAQNWEYIRNIVSNSNYQMAQNWIAQVGSQWGLLWTSSGLITSCLCQALASSGSDVFSRAEDKQLLLTVLPIRAY
jgi:hypothetical protein